MWANRVWPPLPQLTLWPESHIISTHFTNHDMANMRRLKPQSAALPAKHASVLCKQASRFDSHSVPVPCHCPYGAVCLKGYESALTTHEIPTSVPRTLCLSRQNSTGNNRASLWGEAPSSSLTHPSVWSFISQSKWLYCTVFLGLLQGDTFVGSHLQYLRADSKPMSRSV